MMPGRDRVRPDPERAAVDRRAQRQPDDAVLGRLVRDDVAAAA